MHAVNSTNVPVFITILLFSSPRVYRFQHGALASRVTGQSRNSEKERSAIRCALRCDKVGQLKYCRVFDIYSGVSADGGLPILLQPAQFHPPPRQSSERQDPIVKPLN